MNGAQMNGEETLPLELSVSEFSARLENYIRRSSALSNIAIRGEISEWRPQDNGNVYFRLKDAEAVLECFAFGTDARRFPAVENGTAVVAQGSIEIRRANSRYQLLAKALRITGEGELYAQYQALIKRFRDEGLFDEARKRALPSFPTLVGLISADADAAEDFRTILRRIAPYVDVRFFRSKVQGFGAELEVADAIERAERARVDLVVVTRGGGSFEDMQPFNTEVAARAIWRAGIPVVTALGHTRNRNIADLVADLAVETPTQAAHAVARSWIEAVGRLRELEGQLDERIRRHLLRAVQRRDLAAQRLINALSHPIAKQRDRLANRERRLGAQSPFARLSTLARRLTEGRTRLPAAASRVLAAASHRLQLAVANLNGRNPELALAQGFAMITLDGKLVRDAAGVPAGALIEAKVQRGGLLARVEGHLDE